MKTRVETREAILRLAAKDLLGLLQEKPQACIALSAHEDCLALYAALREEAGSAAPFAKACFFAVEEFDGIAPDAPESCRSRLTQSFLAFADPRMERSNFLSLECLNSYDEQISFAGGLDLAVLGLGMRAQIGFNEPATPFDSFTHRQKLTRSTKQALSSHFGDESQVPAYGLTMGIHSLVLARQICVIALGEERAESVFRTLYARNDSIVPAAFLQLPTNVCIYLDKAASTKAFS